MKNNASDILRTNKLSVTDSRKLILNMFLSEKAGALKHADIERMAANRLDRVTIYRSLQVFSDKGIIHTIPGIDGSARYALCHNGCEEGLHHDNHVHFVCTQCSITKCIDNVSIPEVTLPTGFKPLQTEMVITGVCDSCCQN
ncbi:MAG: transcriptional repressor [Bacteroidetes bacterium]|nr:MAG: transcriptional repressor [Bacteroidota bacterium]